MDHVLIDDGDVARQVREIDQILEAHSAMEAGAAAGKLVTI